MTDPGYGFGFQVRCWIDMFTSIEACEAGEQRDSYPIQKHSLKILQKQSLSYGNCSATSSQGRCSTTLYYCSPIEPLPGRRPNSHGICPLSQYPWNLAEKGVLHCGAIAMPGKSSVHTSLNPTLSRSFTLF